MPLTIPDSLLASLADALAAALADKLAPRLAQALRDLEEPLVVAGVKNPPARRKLFYREHEVADMLGISGWTLKRARLNGEIASANIGRMVRYDQENIDAAVEWLRNRR